MLWSLILFAEEAAKKDAAAGGGGGSWMTFMPFILIGILAWLMLFRPAQRREREHKALISALKKNDKVVAAGGIIGTVITLKEGEDEVTIKSGDQRIAVLRSSIMRVVKSAEAGEEAPAQ